MKDAYTKTPEQVLSDLHSDGSGGLTKEQAEQSRKKYGSNTFIRESHESLLKKIWDASTEPMLLMLIFAAVITLGVNIARYMTGGEYNFLECAGIFAAIALSVVITIVTEGKSAKAFEALNRINEDTLVKALRDNSPQLIPPKDSSRNTRPVMAGFAKLQPRPPNSCFTTATAKTQPMAASHRGRVTGRFSASSTPVSIALPSVTVTSFCMSR